MKRVNMKTNFNFLMDNLNRINMPTALVDAVKNGKFEITIHHTHFAVRNTSDNKVVVDSSAISKQEQLLKLGSGSGMLQ